MEDEQIIDLYWKRDEDAIRATADTYGSYCYQIALRITENPEDASECVNDTYMNAWNTIPPHRPNRLSTFLGKITRNTALNLLKQQSAQKRGSGQTVLALAELEECIPSPLGLEQIADEIALTNAIEAFLRRQNRTARNLFIGRYWHLYSVSALAHAYKMRESTVASYLHRMRKKLKLHLEKEGIFL